MITSVNSFHLALKYTWEISETSLAFLNIKVSISGNGLCTNVHYKPTDSKQLLDEVFVLEDLQCNTSERYRSIVGWVRFLSLFKNCTHISLLPPAGTVPLSIES